MENSYTHFKEMASHFHPNQIPVEESGTIITTWIDEAVAIINDHGIEEDSFSFLSDFSDRDMVWGCRNPKNADDDTDYIDLVSAGMVIDYFVSRIIAECQRYFKDAEDNLYTLDTLRYEFDSFMETADEFDRLWYESRKFVEWIDDWFLSGGDTEEITKEEYEALKH